VELLPDEREVDEFDERRLQFVADLAPAVLIEAGRCVSRTSVVMTSSSQVSPIAASTPPVR
jgi:hypothetical protein